MGSMRTLVTDRQTDIKSRRCSHEMDLKILTGKEGEDRIEGVAKEKCMEMTEQTDIERR